MKKKMYTLLVLILCVTMVFTSCGTGGTSSNSSDSAGSAYTATTGDDKEVTVDEDDVKLETEIVSGDPSEVGPKSLKETIKDTVKGIFGKDRDETDSSDDAQDVQTGDNTSSVTTVSTDSEKADKTSTVDANSVIGAAIKSKIESEEKQKEIEKASQTNVSSASDTTGYDENGDPEVPYDELNEEAFEDPDVKYADNAILIKFDKTFGGKLTKGLKKAGIGKLEYIFGTSEYSWYTGYILKSANLAETMENVRSMDNVITAEYNYVSEAAADTSDAVQTVLTNNPRTGEQSVLNSCGIKEAWASLEEKGISAGGSSDVVVAVIDTGVDYTHVDLKANMWKNTGETEGDGVDNDNDGYVDDVYGVDITAGKGSAMDDEGHGTHVAGIIAASNNKEGIVGIAYNTKIMAIKAGDASGYFLENNVAKAIIYAYEHGADVINMSFGSTAASSAVEDALTTAYTSCVLVASAGNSGQPNEYTDYYGEAPNYPAAFSFVLGVMSVDSDNTESYFTNWDAKLYNSVEYEVYAPGEQILSTLPGDRYAKLSGTSMAAPVVAAEAALLRSYYNDTTKYPTKYIYGQIVSGTADEVTCANPQKHTVGHLQHNIPGVVDFAKAIDSVPKPDIGISDYTLFDTAGFSADTEEITKGCEEINNGDGIIDAGETFALGFTLRNRWGMSKNTKVHIDADSSTAGIANPYVTFLNNDLEYGSIGTYSESDSGKLYTDEDKWTGWENPFYVKVSSDCPNNYSIKLNITVTYENGLDDDDDDTKTYTSTGQALFVVRRGIEVSGTIEEDTTWTNDNYYIIENGTTIAEGITVTVEEGTQIQFWCSDAEDAYADKGIAELKVDGKFICNGTEDQPIEIFPSSWMDKYRVRIYSSRDGYVELNHTNITNPYLYDMSSVSSYSYKGIDVANNCEFKQNYKAQLKERYLNNGTVKESVMSAIIRISEAKNCLFYMLGGTISSDNHIAHILGNYSQCAFVDSSIKFDATLSGCVFYGNNNYYKGGSGGATSTFTAKETDDTFSIEYSTYDYENGRMYIIGSKNEFDDYKSQAGLSYATITNESQLEQIQTITSQMKSYIYKISDIVVDENGNVYYTDGTKVPESILSDSTKGLEAGTYNAYLTDDLKIKTGTATTVLYQVRFPIYLDDIFLKEYLVDIDKDSTYQIEAEVTPATADPTDLIYVSSNEEVATVDSNGLVTPKALGTTQIKVYSPDEAIYTCMTVNVRSITIPEKVELTPDDITLQIGETYETNASITPRYSTKRQLSYESSNPEIAYVDETGKITALATGEVVIKVTVVGCEGIEDSTSVHCVLPATKLKFEEDVYMTNMDKVESHDFYPTLYPTGTTENVIEWESASPDICYVDEEGDLVKKKCGVATLKATIRGTQISDTIQVVITDKVICSGIKKAYNYNSQYYVLLNNGTLWTWGDSVTSIKQLTFSGVNSIQDFIRDSSSEIYIVDENNVLKKYKISDGTVVSSFNSINNVTALSEGSWYSGSMYAITVNGGVWAWGVNSNGQLGDGSKSDTNTPVSMNINKKVKEVIYYGLGRSTWILCEDGELYALGGSQKVTEPMLALEGVTDIHTTYGEFNDKVVVETQTKTYLVDTFDGKKLTDTNAFTKSDKHEKYNGSYTAYIQDGIVYIKGSNGYGQLGTGSSNSSDSSYSQVVGITDAKEIYFFSHNIFVELNDGSIYAMGKGSGYELGNGVAEDSNVPVRLYFGLDSLKVALECEGWNHAETSADSSNEPDNTICIDFNGEISISSAIGKISLVDSSGVASNITRKIDLDKLYITPRDTLTKGGEYTLTIPAGALQNYFNSQNSVITLKFTYDGQPVLTSWNHTEEEVADTAGETAGTVDSAETVTPSDDTGTDLDTDENVEAQKETVNIVTDEKLALTYDVKLFKGGAYNAVTLKNSQNVEVPLDKDISGMSFELTPKTSLVIGEAYTLTIPEGALISRFEDASEETVLTFTYNGSLQKTKDNLTTQDDGSLVLGEDCIRLTYNGTLAEGTSYANVALTTEKTVSSEATSSGSGNGGTNEVTDEDTDATDESTQSKTTETTETVSCNIVTRLDGQSLIISLPEGSTWEDGKVYTLTIPAGAVKGTNETTNVESVINFTYKKPEAQTDSSETEQPGQKQDTTETITPDSNEPAIPDDSEYDVKNGVVRDEEKIAARTYPSVENIVAEWNQYVKDGLNTLFKGNAILNRLIDDDVTKWLRISAPTGTSDLKVALGGNYWGTTSEFLIESQILDNDSGFTDLANINEGKYLTEAPSDVWPFVVDAYVMVDGKEVETVDNQEVTFVVEFNRDMDTTIPLSVKFGSSYPYGDYEVSGEYKTARRWEGTMKLNTMIENGYQRFSISNGKAAGTSMKLFTDWGRFQFKINTTEAQALSIQAERTSDGIKLSWKQDDFETLAGFNIYRATEENGLYEKLNKSIISAEESEWLDSTVSPGEVYYYNFTVVESDMTESEPSGTIKVRAFDTLAPGIRHSQVNSAFTGSKLVISANVTDNVGIDTVTLYYRIKSEDGSETENEWLPIRMTNYNDKYTAAITSNYITTAGLEYYIEAKDNEGNLEYSGSAENPYEVTVKVAVDESSKGDVDGNGVIEVKDAMILLLALNHRMNLTDEQFARADIDGSKTLTEDEALRILKYINGTITSIVA